LIFFRKKTIGGREHSNLSDNTIYYSIDCCRKGVQWTDFNTNLTSQAGGLDENLVIELTMAGM